MNEKSYNAHSSPYHVSRNIRQCSISVEKYWLEKLRYGFSVGALKNRSNQSLVRVRLSGNSKIDYRDATLTRGRVRRTTVMV